VDGTPVPAEVIWLPGYASASNASSQAAIPLNAVFDLAPGAHTISVQWASLQGVPIFTSADASALDVTLYNPFPSFATTTSISDQPVILGADGTVTVNVSSPVGALAGACR
jgi:hypothetical protein